MQVQRGNVSGVMFSSAVDTVKVVQSYKLEEMIILLGRLNGGSGCESFSARVGSPPGGGHMAFEHQLVLSFSSAGSTSGSSQLSEAGEGSDHLIFPLAKFVLTSLSGALALRKYPKHRHKMFCGVLAVSFAHGLYLLTSKNLL